MEPVGALTTFARKVTKVLGMAIGYGLANDIREAYTFIMNNFEEGDRLFLIGFSRGAYTVRAVASLLHKYGLIRRGNEPLVPYAIRMMMAIQRYRGDEAKHPSEMAECPRTSSRFASLTARPAAAASSSIHSSAILARPLSASR